MSSAFVKERDDEWLHEISPTIHALSNYLTRENNGILVTERSSYLDPELQKEVYKMSNGLSYFVNKDGQWEMI